MGERMSDKLPLGYEIRRGGTNGEWLQVYDAAGSFVGTAHENRIMGGMRSARKIARRQAELQANGNVVERGI